MEIDLSVETSVFERNSEMPNKELGNFLRKLRERTSPEGLGFSGEGRRRTPGLRREEVASLCQISTTWYSWIEQGRDVSVSTGVLLRLSEIFRISEAQREYLFNVAGKQKEKDASPPQEPIPEAVVQIVRSYPHPAYVLDGSWNAVRWNSFAEELFIGWLSPGSHFRNLLEYMFLSSEALTLVVSWEERARRLVGDFRADCGSNLHDPLKAKLIEKLQRESSPFQEFWNEEDVSWRESGEKIFHHPKFGRLIFDQATFRLVERRDLKVSLFVPIDTRDFTVSQGV